MVDVHTLKIEAGSVENIGATWFATDVIHRINIMHTCGWNLCEYKNGRLYIILRVNLYGAFLLSESCPLKHVQEQIYNRGIERIYRI